MVSRGSRDTLPGSPWLCRLTSFSGCLAHNAFSFHWPARHRRDFPWGEAKTQQLQLLWLEAEAGSELGLGESGARVLPTLLVPQCPGPAVGPPVWAAVPLQNGTQWRWLLERMLLSQTFWRLVHVSE